MRAIRQQPATARRRSMAMTLAGWMTVAATGMVAAVVVLRPSSNASWEFQPAFAAGMGPAVQRAPARVWRAVRWSGRVEVISAGQLQIPAFPGIDASGRISVLDAKDYSIRTAAAGAPLRIRPIPTAILTETSIPITDMIIGPDGFTWLCGPSGRIVGYRDKERRHLPLGGNKLALLGDRFLVVQMPGSRYLFELYDPSSGARTSFGEFLEQQERVGLVLDGKIAVDAGSGAMFYAPNHNSFIASYDFGGRRRFVISTIEHRPLPKTTDTPTGRFWRRA